MKKTSVKSIDSVFRKWRESYEERLKRIEERAEVAEEDKSEDEQQQTGLRSGLTLGNRKQPGK